MAVHALPRKYKCQYCNSRFRTERHYTSHQKNHLDYFCDICHKKFPSAFALKVHKRMHVGASVKMFGCEECDHFFADVSTYYNHMKRRHGKIELKHGKAYLHSNDNVLFTQISGLNTTDAKKIAKIVEPNGSMLIFSLTFPRQINRVFICVFISVAAKPYVCELCGKDFLEKSSLKAHSVIHMDDRPFQCDRCPKA